MASAQEVTDELLGTNAPQGHHDTVVHRNGPIQRVARTVQDKVTTAVAEITLWLPRRTLRDLRAKAGKVDTNLGHSIDAASASLLALEVALRIAENLDIDLDGIDGLE